MTRLLADFISDYTQAQGRAPSRRQQLDFLRSNRQHVVPAIRTDERAAEVIKELATKVENITTADDARAMIAQLEKPS